MPVSLKDQVVLVVGASSGIGKECAVLFAKEGARVMAAARREERLRSLPEHGINIFVADAAETRQMEKLARHTQEKLGPVDVMIYATGTNVPERALHRLTPAIWDMVVGVNVSGAYYITQALLPSMRERKSGHLMYVSSISGLVPDVSGAAYQASKRGMIGLSHAVRVEEKENGIRTSVICPGLVDTEILDKRPVKPPPEMLAKALQAEDVAEMLLAIAKLPARATVPELQLMPTVL